MAKNNSTNSFPLEICNAQVFYGDLCAVRNANLILETGKFYGIYGPNGAGKTSFVNAIFGVSPSVFQKKLFWGESCLRRDPAYLLRKGACLVPEGRAIFQKLSVYQNLELGGWHTPKALFKEQLQIVLELFPRLQDRRDQLGGTLSGGEQQMLALGRALMSRPKLLVCDEPGLGLAPKLAEEVYFALQKIVRNGVTLLCVEQNRMLLDDFTHQTWFMDCGALSLN